MDKDANSYTKYWLHKIDKKTLKNLHKEKILGAEKKRSLLIKKIEINDKIILFTTLDINKSKNIRFIGYTMVDEVYDDGDNLYKHYYSPRKLKLKGIKYFTDPVIAKDLATELNFIENKKKPANYFKSEYREINKEDFNKIRNKSGLSKEYPAIFEKVSFTTDQFLLNSIKGIYYFLRKNEKNNQIEIKKFLKLLNTFLQPFALSKTHKEIEEFYSINAWKLGFKHKPSRDPDKFFTLYNRRGQKRTFSYISLD